MLSIGLQLGCNLAGYECIQHTDCLVTHRCVQGWCELYCQEGQQRSCYTGPVGTQGQGNCKAGRQVCSKGSWGPCTQESNPQAEICNQKDDDCDGRVDEGLTCICFIGAQRECYAGPPPTRTQGSCHPGRQVCQSNGTWGSCKGEIGPHSESCNGQDDDCDGKVDNIQGSIALTRPCYKGGTHTLNQGECKAGRQSCIEGRWSTCQGEVLPQPEICNGLDDNCDGKVDETCGRCAPTEHFRFIGQPFEHKAHFVAWSPNATYLLAASDTHTVQFWRYPKNTYIRSILTKHPIRLVRITPDSRHVAIVQANHSIELYNIATGAHVRSFIGHIEPIRDIAFTRDSRFMLSTTETDTLFRWSVSDGKLQKTWFKTDIGGYTQLAILPSDQLAAIHKGQQNIWIWDLRTGTLKQKLGACDGKYIHIAPSTATQLYALCRRADHTSDLRHYTIQTGALIHTFKLQNARAQTAVFSPDAQFVLVHSGHPTGPQLFRTQTGRVEQIFDLRNSRPGTASILSSAFHPKGDFLFFANGSKRLWLWKRSDSKPSGSFTQPLQRHTHPIHSLAVSPKGTQLATTAKDGGVYLWDIGFRGKASSSFGKLQTQLTGPTGSGSVVAYSPDGKWLAHEDVHHQIVLWNLATLTIHTTLARHTQDIQQLIFTPDSRYLISASSKENVAILWSVQEGQFVRFLAHQEASYIALEPKGQFAAIGQKKQIQLLDIKSEHIIQTMSLPSGLEPLWMAFHPTLHHLLLITDKLHFWNRTTQKSMLSFPIFLDNPNAALHPHGALVALQESQTHINFYTYPQGKMLQQLAQSKGWARTIRSIAFSPVANLFFTGHQNGWVRAWRCTQRKLP